MSDALKLYAWMIPAIWMGMGLCLMSFGRCNSSNNLSYTNELHPSNQTKPASFESTNLSTLDTCKQNSNQSSSGDMHPVIPNTLHTQLGCIDPGTYTPIFQPVYLRNQENHVGNFPLYTIKKPNTIKKNNTIDKASLHCAPYKIALRSFTADSIEYILIVDPVTCNTHIIKDEQGLYTRFSSDIDIQSTVYGNALEAAAKKPYPCQNDGIIHALNNTHGVFLTIDLCPTEKGVDLDFLKACIASLPPAQHPIPVTFCVSGKMLEYDPEAFEWIQVQEKESTLDVTWANHSYYHRYYRNLPFYSNFMLLPGTDIIEEILTTEQLLLEHGCLPSIFFRFPGLVSNKTLVESVRALGLISVGSDAWLGKDQYPNFGSIILIHGNSCEPLGIQRFFNFLQHGSRHITPGEIVFLPLTQALAIGMNH